MSVAKERLDRLEKLAAEAVDQGEIDRSRRYVRLARRIAERQRLSFPAKFDRSTCDRCDAYLRPGVNARVRLRNGMVVITCDCGHHHRYGYHG